LLLLLLLRRRRAGGVFGYRAAWFRAAWFRAAGTAYDHELTCSEEPSISQCLPKPFILLSPEVKDSLQLFI
jgi:hypothetical protein